MVCNHGEGPYYGLLVENAYYTTVFCCCLLLPRCVTNGRTANSPPIQSIILVRCFLSSLVVMTNEQRHKFEHLTFDRLNIWSF